MLMMTQRRKIVEKQKKNESQKNTHPLKMIETTGK